MTLEERLRDSPYQAYAYSYPHKSAYRPLEPVVPLDTLWSSEDRDALFLYVHVPFCEMRCGFCNLFTVARPKVALDARYLDALTRQCEAVRGALGEESRFARLAIGGGTPTFLETGDLERLFDTLEGVMGVQPKDIPVFCEMSPETIDGEKLALLRERGVDRASIGIQSFLESETRALGRPQKPEVAHRALGLMREAGFPIRNLDLIYGIEGQTPESWRESLEAALRYEPEEIYLYPLYVRPLTGLGRKQERAAHTRSVELYRLGRDLLRERGYSQRSMRMFQADHAPELEGPPYRCQEDGMVGLGPGARSYTQALHYCTEYAVSRRGVIGIIEDYLERDHARFAHADYGIHLDVEEQRRRFVIQSLLNTEGLSRADYTARFGDDPGVHLPELAEITALGLGAWGADGRLTLNDDGLERSDVLGPWLFSAGVQQRMEGYELR